MNKTLKLSTILALTITANLCVNAKNITPEQAINRLLTHSASKMMKRGVAKDKIRLAHTFSTPESNEKACIYIFNKGDNGGYIVAPADDAFPAIIGFGDSGNFEIQTIPYAMKCFLEDYAKEIDFIAKNAEEEMSRTAFSDPGWAPISPLLKSKWDQGLPYSLNCPPLEIINTDGTLTGDKIPTVTGCVATSMAQVMYYHKWPDVGVGSNSYEWKTYSDVLSKKLTCDFSQMHFDWDNMLDTYSYDSEGNPAWTDAQAKAVADLMYACGISVNMTYNMEQAGGSGAVSRTQATALVNNFKYSKGIRYKYRDYCSSLEFEKIIYENLKEGLPVLYNGRGTAGGHSFVCDGYAGNHYFHFNWGWSGMSDGYFYLARLNPSSLGIGGASGGFNSLQGISYNIRPVKDGVDTGVAEQPYLNCVGNFAYSTRQEEKSANGQTLMFTIFKVTDPINGYNAGFWNMSSVPFTGYIGVAVEDSEGNNTFVPGLQLDKTAANSGVTQLPAYLESFEEGTYLIRPAYLNSETEEIEFISVANGYRDRVRMIVNANGTRTFSEIPNEELAAEAPDLIATCFNYNGKIRSNISHDYLLSVTNLSKEKDYYGDLTMVLKDDKGRVLATKPLGKYDIPAGLNIPYSFALTLDVLTKDYKVSFRDSYGRDLPGEYPLSVSAKGTSIETQLRTMSYSPLDIEPYSVVPAVTFGIGNYGSTDVEAPEFAILYNKLGETQAKGWRFSYPNLTIPSGKAYNLQLTGVNFNLEEGDYEVRVYWFPGTKESDGKDTQLLISNPYSMRVGYPVENVTLTKSSLELNLGEATMLEASVNPDNATFRTLAWVSSNPEVVTVDNSGYLTAVGEGHAFITATAHNGSSDICEVTVKDPSGISDIQASGARIIAVYSASGIKVLDSPSAESLLALPAGLYLVHTDAGTYKIVK